MWFTVNAAGTQDSGLLDWLNLNSGAIQALSTVVLVVVTLGYVLLTRQMVQAMKASQRPYIYLDVAGHVGLLELGVNNYGERAAEHVKFTILKEIADRHGKPISEGTPLRRGIRYLPPGQGYRFDAIVASEVYTGPAGANVLDLKVTYKYGGKSYEDQLTIDFADFEGASQELPRRDRGDRAGREADCQ